MSHVLRPETDQLNGIELPGKNEALLAQRCAANKDFRRKRISNMEEVA